MILCPESYQKNAERMRLDRASKKRLALSQEVNERIAGRNAFTRDSRHVDIGKVHKPNGSIAFCEGYIDHARLYGVLTEKMEMGQ